MNDTVTTYPCGVCGAHVLRRDSLTDHHTAAAISKTDGRKGNAARVPCDRCNGTGRLPARVPGSLEPVTVYCKHCDALGSVSACDDTRRVCKPCARAAFHVAFTTRAPATAAALRAACVLSVL